MVTREVIPELSAFYAAVTEDNRMTTTHISLYMALFQLYNQNHFQNPVEITRRLLMGLAKINGLATYHKCIKDLHHFGYIDYEPSFNPGIPSLARILPHGPDPA
jgi:hypothetical protein